MTVPYAISQQETGYPLGLYAVGNPATTMPTVLGMGALVTQALARLFPWADTTATPGTAQADAREAGEGRPSLEDLLREIADQVPAKAWRKVPTDLAGNLDHYLYGAPRR